MTNFEKDTLQVVRDIKDMFGWFISIMCFGGASRGRHEDRYYDVNVGIYIYKYIYHVRRFGKGLCFRLQVYKT